MRLSSRLSRYRRSWFSLNGKMGIRDWRRRSPTSPSATARSLHHARLPAKLMDGQGTRSSAIYRFTRFITDLLADFMADKF